MKITYHLKLFVAGATPKSALAITNVNEFCEQYLKGQYLLEIIDLIVNPELAGQHNILAVPTLLKTDPEPMRRLIGILADKAKFLSVLNITAA
jgi:circadian clock protein KaiB